jgi:diadenosine tetraphosphate (Ap4A) HIT family hydrolase
MTCVFCTDVHQSGTVVFEDGRAWVVLHPDWSPRGHAMIVSKQHVENASSLDQDEWLHLARVWHRAERVLLEVTGAERAIAMKLGIATPHLHVHLYPMRAADDRARVFDAIEGNLTEPRDESFIDELRRRLY